MAFDTPSDTSSADLPERLRIPILAIRNTVIFPVLAFPINVGRERSVRSVEHALASEHKYLGIFAQRDPKTEDPAPGELYQVGTVVKILKMVKVPGNKLNVIIQGLARARVVSWDDEGGFLEAELETFPTEGAPPEAEALMGKLRELAQKIIDLSPQIPAEASFLVRSIDEPGVLADIVATNLSIPPTRSRICSRRSA
jgi:ATP-dependent Lon protease